jgi:hypothetical protein
MSTMPAPRLPRLPVIPEARPVVAAVENRRTVLVPTEPAVLLVIGGVRAIGDIPTSADGALWE